MTYNLRDIATYSANKKRLLYLAIVAGAVFLIFIGVWIEGKITDSAEQNARMYQTALQTTSDEQLNYAIDTKQGRVLAPITLKAVDLVKFPEMNKEYSRVKKVEETYTRHYRTVCTYGSDGNVKECHPEAYYTWDTTDSWEVSSKEVSMAGRNYPTNKFKLNYDSIAANKIIKNEKDSYVYVRVRSLLSWGDNVGDKRYSYYVSELPKSGTVFLNVIESVEPVFGNSIELYTKSSEDLVQGAQNSAKLKSTIFTVLWVFLVLVWLVGLGLAVYNY